MTISRQPNRATDISRKWDVRCAINVGAGFVDLSTYRRPVTVSGAMEVKPAPSGIVNKQGTSGPFVTVPTGMASGKALTLVAITNGSASSTPVGVSNVNNGNYGPALVITSGVPALKFRGSSGTIVSMNGPTIATGGDLAIACTWIPGVGIRGSFNGQDVQLASLADVTGNVLSSTLFFGNSPTVNTYFAAVIAGSVSDAELRQLSANPWQICADPVLKTIYEQATAAGSALAGAASAIASASGALSVAVPVTGAAIGVASASGALSTAMPLSGVAAAVAVASGALTLGIALSGAAMAAASASGNMQIAIALSGSAIAQAAATGSLGVSGGAALAGSATAQAIATGALSVAVPLAGAAQVVASAAGNLTTGSAAALAGAAVAVAAASGALTVTVSLSGAAMAQAVAAGGMRLQVPLSGQVVMHATAMGYLSGGQAALASDPRYTVIRKALDAAVWHSALDTTIAANPRNLTVHAH